MPNNTKLFNLYKRTIDFMNVFPDEPHYKWILIIKLDFNQINMGRINVENIYDFNFNFYIDKCIFKTPYIMGDEIVITIIYRS